MKRCTVNLAETSHEASLIADLMDSSTGAHLVLAELVPDEPLNSESSVLRALLKIAGRTIQEQALAAQYNAAMDAGAFDEEEAAWHRASAGTTRRMGLRRDRARSRDGLGV